MLGAATSLTSLRPEPFYIGYIGYNTTSHVNSSDPVTDAQTLSVTRLHESNADDLLTSGNNDVTDVTAKTVGRPYAPTVLEHRPASTPASATCAP